MTAEPTNDSSGPRPRGRPRLEIDPDAVADAVAQLFAEGGLEAVSILDTAEMLEVSRATLYRSVPTKEHLLGILFERSTAQLADDAKQLIGRTEQPTDQLLGLVRLQVDAAIRMRRYMLVFFGGGDLPPDVLNRWRTWSRDFERIWVDVVEQNMVVGKLAAGDPVIVARLLLGACIWVSRWYRPSDGHSPDEIIATAVNLVTVLQGKRPRNLTASEPAKKATKPTPATGD